MQLASTICDDELPQKKAKGQDNAAVTKQRKKGLTRARASPESTRGHGGKADDGASSVAPKSEALTAAVGRAIAHKRSLTAQAASHKRGPSSTVSHISRSTVHNNRFLKTTLKATTFRDFDS